jgi:hypothetical protein
VKIELDPEVIVARAEGREGWLREARRQLDEHRRREAKPIERSRAGRLLESERRRRGWQGGRYAWMRTVLATDHGAGLYRRRKVMVEPVFAQTKHSRRIDHFQRRGRSAVRSEWRLITATHNLMKLHRHQLATAAA